MIFITLLKLLSLFTYIASGDSPYGDTSCAPFISNSFETDGGFKLRILNATFNGDKRIIYEQLYQNSELALNTVGLSQYEVTDLSLNIPITDTDEPVSGVLYSSDPLQTTLSNFSMVAMGIFVPPETGDYTFSIDDVSDGGAIFLFNDPDLYCCSAMDYQNWLPTTTKVYNIPGDTEHTVSSQTIHMVKGLGYLFLYSYINLSGDAIFKPTLTLPSGDVVSDLSAYLKTSFNDLGCGIGNGTSTIISQGTEIYTTTYLTSISTKIATGLGVLQYTEYETIYYVLTPVVVSSSSTSSSSSSVAEITSSVFSPSASSTVVSSSSLIMSSEDITSSSSSSSSSSSYSIIISSATPTSISVSLSTVETASSSGSSELPISSGNSASIIESSSIFTSSTITSSPLISSISSTVGVNTVTSGGSNSIILSSSSDANGFTNSSTISHQTSQVELSSTEDSNDLSRSTTDTFKSTSIESSISSSHSKITKTTIVGDKTSSFSAIYATSTFTDENGATKTITVACATELKSSTSSIFKNSVIGNKGSSDNILEHEQSTASTALYISTKTNSERMQTVVSGSKSKMFSRNNNDYNTAFAEKTSSLSQTPIIQAISSTSSVRIQEAPNEASNGIISLFYLMLSVLFSTFFI